MKDFKCWLRRNVAALFMAIMLIGVLAFVGYMGWANVFENSIRGNGSADLYTQLPTVKERVMTTDAIAFDYKAKMEWINAGKDDPETVFSSSYLMEGGQGKYKDQYSIEAKYADNVHSLKAMKLSGDFAAGSNIFTTSTSGDSVYFQEGTGTFRGRVTDWTTGKPATRSETDLVGYFIVEQHLNLTKPIETSDDWLAFCDTIDDEMAKDKELKHLKLVPIRDTKNATIEKITPKDLSPPTTTEKVQKMFDWLPVSKTNPKLD